MREWLRRLRNRLQRIRANRSERMATETEEQREARLQRDRERHIGNNNTHYSHCLSNHLCKQKCHSQFSTLDLPTVLPVLRDFLASNFIHACASIIRVHYIVSSGSPQTMPCMTIVYCVLGKSLIVGCIVTHACGTCDNTANNS